MKIFEPKPLSFVELFKEGELKGLREKLANFNFSLEQYVAAEGKLLDIADEEGNETMIYTLKELIDYFLPFL